MNLTLPEVLNLLRIGLEDETDLSGGVESRHAESPYKYGDLAKDGLMVSAHSLVQPNNASGSSAPPAQFTLSALDRDRTPCHRNLADAGII